MKEASVPPFTNVASGRSVENAKLVKRLRHSVGKAIGDFGLISDGDRILVCVSGGKDSYAMLDLLLQLKEVAPVSFEIRAINLDQKQPGFPPSILPAYLSSLGVPFHILEQDTYSVVRRVIPEGKTMCSLCSRLRRGAIYDYAKANGFNKIALGHHADDVAETLFLNIFFQARIAAMPPKLCSDDGSNVVIRPLYYCRERDLLRYSDLKSFPIIPCNLCGSQENLQRKQIRAMLDSWEEKFAGRMENVLRSVSNVQVSQLADSNVFDFAGLGEHAKVAMPNAHDWLAGKGTKS